MLEGTLIKICVQKIKIIFFTSYKKNPKQKQNLFSKKLIFHNYERIFLMLEGTLIKICVQEIKIIFFTSYKKNPKQKQNLFSKKLIKKN